jgi:acetyltransferase-like isoleucine patch superfamily enzyme
MIDRQPLEPSFRNRVRSDALTVAGEVARWSWQHAREMGAIGPRSRIAHRFGSFGNGTIVSFPYETLINVAHIHLGTETMIARYVSLSAGWHPEQPDLPDRVVSIGDRCLIGRGSTVIGHRSIEIGNDVWTGHHVHITDMNHGYEDLDTTISRQAQPEAPVSIGDGSWLGHGVVVLPGSHIGRHVVVGAGSVVTGDLPDCSGAVGAPAVVIRRHTPGDGWVAVDRDARARVGH